MRDKEVLKQIIKKTAKTKVPACQQPEVHHVVKHEGGARDLRAQPGLPHVVDVGTGPRHVDQGVGQPPLHVHNLLPPLLQLEAHANRNITWSEKLQCL